MERIKLKGISKQFKIGFKKNQGTLLRLLSFFSGREPKKIIWALKNVSLAIDSGEIVGIVGKNGSGKSTLLRTIAGIYDSDRGVVKTAGRVIPIIGFYAGLKERLTMRDNIYLCGSLFGMPIREVRKRYDSIVRFSELGDFVNTKIYQFSSGMKNRLAFSVAVYCNPDMLLVDEVFEKVDEKFKAKCGNKIRELASGGSCIILVGQDLQIIKKYCKKTIWIEHGKVVKSGNTEEVLKQYLRNHKP